MAQTSSVGKIGLGGSVPVEFPDFTKGKWKTAKRFDVEV